MTFINLTTLRAGVQGAHGPPDRHAPDLARLGVAEPDHDLAELGGQEGEQGQLEGQHREPELGHGRGGRHPQRRQPEGGDGGCAQQAGPGNRPQPDRGAAELAEATTGSTNTRPTNCRIRWWPTTRGKATWPRSSGARSDRLPQRMRAAVMLRYFEDMTEPEIAATLGISLGTVKSTVSRAVARLRIDAELGEGFRRFIRNPRTCRETAPLPLAAAGAAAGLRSGRLGLLPGT